MYIFLNYSNSGHKYVQRIVHQIDNRILSFWFILAESLSSLEDQSTEAF